MSIMKSPYDIIRKPIITERSMSVWKTASMSSKWPGRGQDRD